MSERHLLLAEAARPRRAHAADAPQLARLMAAAFAADPVIDWIARQGPQRPHGLLRFFHDLLAMRAIPLGEVWTTVSGGAVVVWLPPGSTPGSTLASGGLAEQLRLLVVFLRLCGIPRLLRGQAVAEAMERHHPYGPHYHLAFIAVAPRLQGLGLGSALLEATLARIDETGSAAYLQNSNPRNTRLYERAGFASRGNIAPRHAPPLLSMWREGRTRLAGYDSSSLSQ